MAAILNQFNMNSKEIKSNKNESKEFYSWSMAAILNKIKMNQNNFVRGSGLPY